MLKVDQNVHHLYVVHHEDVLLNNILSIYLAQEKLEHTLFWQ